MFLEPYVYDDFEFLDKSSKIRSGKRLSDSVNL